MVLRCSTVNNPGPVTVSVCVPNFNGDDCCGQWSSNIEVKFCENPDNSSDHFYAYRLKNVPWCDMAYCAEKVSISDSSKFKNGRDKYCTYYIA